jgi:hypothetical protein
MSVLEAYLTPHAIGTATYSGGVLSSVGIAVYLNDLSTTSASHAIITPNQQTDNINPVNSIITLPNGGRYDVNQSYQNAYNLAPFTWPLQFAATKAIKSAGLSEDTIGGYLAATVQLISSLATGRCVVICERAYGSAAYAYVIARISAFSTTAKTGSKHQYATGSITFDPISTEWQTGWPTP